MDSNQSYLHVFNSEIQWVRASLRTHLCPSCVCVSFSCLPVRHWHSLSLGWLTTVRAAGWGCSCWETDTAHLESFVPSFAALVPYGAYNLHVSFSNLTFLSGTQHFKIWRKDFCFLFWGSAPCIPGGIQMPRLDQDTHELLGWPCLSAL